MLGDGSRAKRVKLGWPQKRDDELSMESGAPSSTLNFTFAARRQNMRAERQAPLSPAAPRTSFRRCDRRAARQPRATLPAAPLDIALIFTTFPKSTETFLQREVTGLRAHGARLRLYSMWGGGGVFAGLPVVRFPKWKLLALLWCIPLETCRRPRAVGELLRGLFTRRAPSWLNFWENMLGAGFACVHAGAFRQHPPAHTHAVWSGGPATAAWLLWRLNGQPYGAAAHAYDLYDRGGDWWLREKLAPALFVRTSTEMGGVTLRERGVPAEKIYVIRRGLVTLPPLKPLRSARTPLRLLCVARLVPKKGLDLQLNIYAALKSAGVAFEARIAGEGPLRAALYAQISQLGLAAEVRLLGHRPQAEIAELLAWADVLLHTGVVAPGGDRDGLPNVIPEAMAAGVNVVTSPAAATTEAIADRVTGLVAPPEEPARWVAALCALVSDDVLADRLRLAARGWVEENFDAGKNTAKLLALLQRAAAAPAPQP
jgi:colanic acid/amylovoran biosynthesis glycosyltransferase